MFGICKAGFVYENTSDKFAGNASAWWQYHQPIYDEVRRVLRPNGTIAWAMACKFRDHFLTWFGGNRIWSLTRYHHIGLNPFGHIWMCQTREQKPIRFPDRDGLVICDTPKKERDGHPCPKALAEMEFLVEELTSPGAIVLDTFAGIGTTLVAAKQLGRQYIGMELSPKYCSLAKQRLQNKGG